MEIPYYFWIIGAAVALAVILFLIRKYLHSLRRIKGFKKRQQFWLQVRIHSFCFVACLLDQLYQQHRNTLTGNFVTTYTDPIEDTYILDKDDELLGEELYWSFS